MKSISKYLVILAVTVFAIGCKKDSVVDTDPIDFKVPFETVYKNVEYSVNINPAAEFYLPPNNSESGERQVYTNGLVTQSYKNFVWVLKPVANANWSILPTKTVLIQSNGSYADLNSYMLDQVLMPNEFNGASSIFPTKNLPGSLTSPLKVSVELWKSTAIFPMVYASEVEKGITYNKQTNKGELMETRTLTFNAERFDITPSDVKKGQVIDLKKWIDPSVKLTDDAPVVFMIDGVLITGYNYTVSSEASAKLSIQAIKKYANGYFKMVKVVNASN